MKRTTLVTMLGTGLLAASALPAFAVSEFDKQLQISDGYADQVYSQRESVGAAGRSAAPAVDMSAFERQLKRTDGYSEAPESATVPEGHAGRPAASTEPEPAGNLELITNFEKELKRTDGMN